MCCQSENPYLTTSLHNFLSRSGSLSPIRKIENIFHTVSMLSWIGISVPGSISCLYIEKEKDGSEPPVYGSCIKGSVQRKLRPMLLYIIRTLSLRRWTAKYLNFCLLKGHFTIYIKTCNNPSANCVRGQ